MSVFASFGTQSSTGGCNGTPLTSSDPVTFGFAGYHTYAKAALDDVRIYNRVLTSAEIAGLSPQLKRRYTYGHDLISVTEVGTSTVTHYYGYDGHGSVRFLTDSASGASTTITDWYDYDAYGQLLATDGTTVNHYRYTGEQWDNDLGMYYLRARYLNPNAGRFWTMDSYEGSPSDPLSLHKYLYCHGNPVNGLDPSGREFSLIGLAIASGIATSLQQMYDHVVLSLGFGAMEYLETMLDGQLEDAEWDRHKERWEDKVQRISQRCSEIFAEKYGLPAGLLQCPVIVNLNGDGRSVTFRDPSSLYFSQDILNEQFSHGRGTVHDLASELKGANGKSPENMTPIRLVERQGRLISIDNRRLYAYRKAGAPVPTVLATRQEIYEAENPRPGERPKLVKGSLGTKTPRLVRYNPGSWRKRR